VPAPADDAAPAVADATADANPLPVITTPSDGATAVPEATTTPSDVAMIPAATDPAAASAAVPSEDGGVRRLLLQAVARRALRA
jgi:hypothetical protein